MTGMTGLLIGIDVGTTRIKAVAVGPDGHVRGAAERHTPWRRDGAGHAEAEPMALVELAKTVAVEAVSGLDGQVAGIGVTGMAETGVLVDRFEQPLAPAIAWHDPRGDVKSIEDELGAVAFQSVTGLPLTALPSLSKLLWLRRNVPGTRNANRFYSIPEWVVRCLGGAPVSELSLASRTGLFDVGRCQAWEEATDLLEWPALLADVVVAGTITGNAGGSDLPAVLKGAAVTVAGHDHQVAAFAVGAATDGALFDSLGTAEALVRTIRAPLAPDRIGELAAQGMSVGWGVLAGHLCVLAGLPTGLTLNRLAAMVGATTPRARTILGEQALAEPAGHATLRLVNPRDEDFGIAGITDGVTPPLLWRSAIDAFVAEADRVLARIEAIAGPYRKVVAAGGWLHNPAVLAAKQRQYAGMHTAGIAEPGAYGAALMAAVAAGVSPRPSHAPSKGISHVLQP